MPQKPTKGTQQLAAELPAELVDEFKRWVKGRGEKMRDAIALAIRRHMAYPPPPPAPPDVPPIPSRKPKK